MDIEGDSGKGCERKEMVAVVLERYTFDHKESLGRNEKDALMKPQMEMLLENEQKAILLWQRTG